MNSKRVSFWSGPCYFILPALVIYILFMIVPFIGTISLSLTRWDGISFDTIRYIGFQNYREMYTDNVFWLALKNNLFFVFSAVGFQCILGLIVALLLEQKKLFLGNFLRGSYFIPAILSQIIIGLLFETILNPSLGVLDTLLRKIGLEKLTGLGLWLSSSQKALWILILIEIWYGFGWSMFIFISRLKMIDPQIYEASEIDGASTFQKNIFVTIPMLKSVAPVAILFATMWAMKVFTIPYVITKGGPNHGTEVLATWAFYHGISYQHVGYGSAISVILLIFGMVLGILIFKFTGMGQSKA